MPKVNSDFTIGETVKYWKNGFHFGNVVKPGYKFVVIETDNNFVKIPIDKVSKTDSQEMTSALVQMVPNSHRKALERILALFDSVLDSCLTEHERQVIKIARNALS